MINNRVLKYFKDNYKLCWKFFKDTKRYFLISCIVFLLFALIGFIFPVFYKSEILNYFSSISDKIQNFNLLQMISFILFNNVKAAFVVIIAGFIFGILPIFSLVSNGYILGFAAKYAVLKDGIFSLWKVFPHGVFELPAILLSIAIGMNLGFNVFNKKFKFKGYFFNSIRFFIFVIIPLLIVAALVEGTLVFLLK